MVSCIGRSTHGLMSQTKNTIWHWIFDAAIGFAIALLTLAVIGVISYRETRHLITAQDAVRHSYQVLQSIESVQAGISGKDRAELAFLLTHDERHLENHQQIDRELRQSLHLLHDLTNDSLVQQGRLMLVEQAVSRKEQWWVGTRAQNSAGPPSQQQQKAELLESKLASDSVTSLLAEMTNEEKRLLQARTQEYEVIASRTGRTILVMVVFTFLFLITAYRSIVHDIRARRGTEAALQDLQRQLQEALENEKELARLDSLTGLANRRAFYEVLEMEQKRARRYELPLTVAYLDVDNFKKINDSSGHALGDSVLAVVAQTIKNNIRSSDTVARLGGDEFAVLLPETEAAAAETALRKVQDKLQVQMRERGWTISFSIGVASFLCPPDSLDDIIRTADEVMYAVKASGKNNLSVAILG